MSMRHTQMKCSHDTKEGVSQQLKPTDSYCSKRPVPSKVKLHIHIQKKLLSKYF